MEDLPDRDGDCPEVRSKRLEIRVRKAREQFVLRASIVGRRTNRLQTC
jgi:hypothetical protein